MMVLLETNISDNENHNYNFNYNNNFHLAYYQKYRSQFIQGKRKLFFFIDEALFLLYKILI